MSLESTIEFVRMHTRIGLASRRRAVPREIPPDFIEAEYAKALVGYVHEWRTELDALIRSLPHLLKQARRIDDTHEGAEVKSAIKRARTVANRTATSSRKAARQAVDHQAKQFQRQMKAGLGVPVPTQDRGVPSAIERFVERNVSLMDHLEAKTLGEIQNLILNNFETDMTVEELGAEIAKRFGIAERRARMIASDQITKLTAQVRQMRAQEVGLATFRWETAGDSKVRAWHAVKDGKVFPWEGSRAPSFFPGEEVNCRCVAVPLVDEIRDKAFPKGRSRIV